MSPAVIVATVYDRDGGDPVELEEAFERTFQEQLNDTGTGQLSVGNDDPVLGDVHYRRLLVFSLDGDDAFTVLVERIQRRIIASGEEQAQVTTISGRGALAVFEEAVIEPALGVDRAPQADTRQFNFAAPDFDDSDWSVATATPITTAPEEARFPNAIDAARDPGDGVWVVGDDGGVATFGYGSFHGSLGGVTLSAPITGIAAHGYGGYWLVGEDGGVFAFGDAVFYGSMAGTPLNGPVVAIVATDTGLGYWLLAADGGVFAFGDAEVFDWIEAADDPFPLAVDACFATDGNGNIVGLWVVGYDGGVAAFGDATFHGSLPPIVPNAPIWAIVGYDGGGGAEGYWLVGRDSGIFAFGDAPARFGDSAMIDFDWAAGVRAVVAAEFLSSSPYGPSFILLADDGWTHLAHD